MTAKPTLGDRLGAGKVAEIFEWGPLVLKLYKRKQAKTAVFREAAILALAESFGLPSPSVEGVELVNGRWGVAMTKADGPSFAEAIRDRPGRVSSYLAAMASLHARIHGFPGRQLAPMKARLEANIRQATMLGKARQRALLDGLAEAPEAHQLCHGDFHPYNILGPLGHEVVVDWPDACSGDPAADVCRSYVLMRPSVPELASAYVDAYAKRAGVSRGAVMRWLPFIAAARLAEGVPEEADGLMQMVDSV